MRFKMLFQRVLGFSTFILLTGMVPAQVASTSAATAPADVKASGNRGSVTGRVLDDEGQPLAGVSVHVFSIGSGRGSRRTSSDDEGNFRIANLPAGAYNIIAIAPGFVNVQGGGTGMFCRLGDNVTITMTKGGVITGKALDAEGQPLVGALVYALRVRDAEGRPLVDEVTITPRPTMSDDRGVYRLYGLQPGFYVVYSGGAGESLSTSIGMREVPTYHPSSTRDTAREVYVLSGSEIQDIDIRHRGESGHAVSGTVVGAIDTNEIVAPNVTIELLQLGTRLPFATANVNLRLGSSFGVYGVPDGEYEIIAQQQAIGSLGRTETNSSASVPRRVTVRGGDVTGLELRLLPLGSIAGRVTLEKLNKTDCQIARRGELAELLLLAQREDRKHRRSMFAGLLPAVIPNDRGEFVIRDLEAGNYRLESQLPSDHWYVKAMNLTGAVPARASTVSIAASGLPLKVGENFSGLALTLAEGAASVSGRVEGKKLPARLRIHLVPAEAEMASAVLRYAEVVTQDGSFSLKNLAPGKYWLLARAVTDDESDERLAKPAAWNANARMQLRRDAAAGNQVIELTPCQRAKDFVLRF